MIRLMTLLTVLTLAACSGPTTLVQYSTAQPDLRLTPNVGSVVVRTVTLPSYAASEEIAVETAPGIIETDGELLWADLPDRAVTLALTSHLDTILGATVGPEPWPFAGLPDASVDVRISEMLAGVDDTFRLTGQYFTGGDGIDYPNRSDSFAIRVPLAGEGVGAVAAAQSLALVELAEAIARNLGR